MGQKVHPKIFRIGTIRTWDSKWFARKDYSTLLQEDILIRKFLQKKLKDASIDKIEIERSAGSINIIISSARPGMIIGRSGVGIEELKKDIKKKFLGSKKISIEITIQEVKQPSLSAAITVQQIANDLEKRIPYRRVMKSAILRIESAGSKGARVIVAGRLNGADIARTETITSGLLPLHTLRADIDYSRGVANTVYGVIGIKVWIYKGEVFEKDLEEKEAEKKVETKEIINQLKYKK
jgi:small subunit ribosomal protein S3